LAAMHNDSTSTMAAAKPGLFWKIFRLSRTEL
jgi:hypothetical protein